MPLTEFERRLAGLSPESLWCRWASQRPKPAMSAEQTDAWFRSRARAREIARERAAANRRR